MYNTVKALIESSVLPKQDFIIENTTNFLSLPKASDNVVLATKFTANKVPVVRYADHYVIEFTDGIERVMENYNLDLVGAVKEVARVNNILVSECVLVVDESAISKVDLSDLDKQNFKVARR